MRSRTVLAAVAATLASPGIGAALAGGGVPNKVAVGHDYLAARLGANVPTGAGVIVGQIEVPNGDGDYRPNPANDEFDGKTFIEESSVNVGYSGHADLVAEDYYGETISIAPGISEIHLWKSTPWMQLGFLNTLTADPPDASPSGLKIYNGSFVASFPSASKNNNILRRADFVSNRDDLLMVFGVNNGSSSANLALMSHVYNGISVGRTNGNHMSADTLATIDGPGRMQPLIVAPGSLTSWVAPVTSAAAALMVQTARETPTEGINPNAERREVIKAVLLAGATHEPGWTNNPATSGANRGVTARPIDDVYGAGTVNVNISHYILTGGEQNGASSPPSTDAAPRAWDLTSVGLGQSRYWRFTSCGAADAVSIVATWNRQVSSPFGDNDWAVADFDLILWRLDGESLATLVGNDGVPWFGSGNVVSESAADNVEHLYLGDLQPGRYVLELRRQDNETGYPNWTAAVAWDWPDLPPPAADTNGDCVVNVIDLLTLLGNWGQCPDPCPPTCPGDVDGDCDVDVEDLLAVLGAWSV